MQFSKNIWSDENLVEILKRGGVAVMPTDTIYGIVGRAEDRDAVERIYKIRKRNPERPCIVLISNIEDLIKFSISLSGRQKEELGKFWPGPVSIILDCPVEQFLYLHRGTNTLAFRLPNNESFRGLLLETGPLVAPSANPEGLPTAKNIDEAKAYFGDSVDFYVDGGEIEAKASKLIKLHKDGSVSILRE
jgi:L-threonylcarbamoyladenylate synthase